MKNKLQDLYPILDEYTENIILKELGDIRLPIDIEKIIDNYGITLKKKSIPNDAIDGAIKIAEDFAIMVINTHNNAEVRQRFTMAHEFGHFISYQYQGKTGEITEFRDGTSSIGINAEEIFANKFAASILIPISKLKKLDLSSPKAFEAFQVSSQAFAIRIKMESLG